MITFNTIGGRPRYNMDEAISDYSLFGTSDISLYVPFYAGFSYSKRITIEGKSFVMWKLADAAANNNRYNLCSNYIELIQALKFSIKIKQLSTTGRNAITVYACKGCLYTIEDSKPVILLMVGVQSNYFLSLDRHSQDYSKFAIFVNRRLQDESKFSNLYRQLVTKGYLDWFNIHKVDLIYTSNIESNLFDNNYKRPVFESPSQMRKYLQSLNDILYD